MKGLYITNLNLSSNILFGEFNLQDILSPLTQLKDLRLDMKNGHNYIGHCNCSKLLLDLFHLKKLRKLELTINNNYCIERDDNYRTVDVQDQSTVLEYLSIGGNLSSSQAEKLITKLIQASPHLKVLEITLLHGINCLSILANSFRNLTRLEHLKINMHLDRGLGVTIEELRNLAKQLKHFKSLKRFQLSGDSSLKHYSSSSVSESLLSSLSNLPLLVELDLSYNRLERIGAVALTKSLPNLTQLSKLNLHWTKIDDNGLKELAGPLENLTQLTVLDFGGNGIGREGFSRGVVALTEALPYLTKLEYIDLSQYTLRNEATQTLSKALPYLKKLEYLDLSSNWIGDEGALALSQSLHHLKNLEYLDLSKNDIKDKGALALSRSLHHLKNLEYLDLSQNHIKDKGALALSRSLHHLKNLEYLDLSKNDIKDEGALALKTSLVNTKKLMYLRLELNRVSAKGVRMIREILKHLHKLIPTGTTSQNCVL